MSRQGCGPLPVPVRIFTLEGWKESGRQASLGADLDISRTVLARARRDYSQPACMLCCLAWVVSVRLLSRVCGIASCLFCALVGYRMLAGVASGRPSGAGPVGLFLFVRRRQMHRPGEIMYDKKRLIREGMSHPGTRPRVADAPSRLGPGGWIPL